MILTLLFVIVGFLCLRAAYFSGMVVGRLQMHAHIEGLTQQIEETKAKNIVLSTALHEFVELSKTVVTGFTEQISTVTQLPPSIASATNSLRYVYRRACDDLRAYVDAWPQAAPKQDDLEILKKIQFPQ